MEDKDSGDLISELILEHMPPRVQDALGLEQNMTTRTKTLKPTEPQTPATTNEPQTETRCHLETEMLECEPEPKKAPKELAHFNHFGALGRGQEKGLMAVLALRKK